MKFFRIRNIKEELISNKMCIYKHIPIIDDLYNLLLEMRYDEKKGADDYLLFPDRKIKSIAIMDSLSKEFARYRKGAGV